MMTLMSLRKEPLVVVKNGKPLAVPSSARGMDKESLALANNRKFAQLIKRSRSRHAAEGGIPLAQCRSGQLMAVP
jgi:hypothetical protein